MAALVIGVNYHNRSPLQFVKITHFPFRIGRAYDNDLILADDAVSAYHLQIERDEEGYVVRNLSMENGTKVGKQPIGLEPENIQTPETLEVGHTELKLLAADTPIAPTKTKIKLTKLSAACMDIRVALVLLAIYLFLNIIFTFQQQAIARDWQEILMDELFSLLMPLGVATITGFLSRLLLHRWRFALQLSIASTLFIGNILLPEITHFVNYVSTNNVLAEVFYEAVYIVGLAVIFAWQLRAVSGMTRKRSNLTSVTIVLPIIALMNLQQILNSSDFSSQPNMHTLLRANDLRFAKTYGDTGSYGRDLSEILEDGIEAELKRAEERSAKENEAKQPPPEPEIDNGAKESTEGGVETTEME